MKHIVAFSGGKDSLATLLLVIEKFGKKYLEVIFCDTGWESPVTYQHIKDVEGKLNIKVIFLKSKKYNGFYDLSIKKKRVASPKARFCTEELKVKPMIDYILSKREHIIIYQGIRAEESRNRAIMQAQCTYFKYYFTKKENGKYDNYKEKEVIEWCKKYNADIQRPLFDWSANKVFDYIKEQGLKPNPLYYEGFTRVGCFPCIMCRHGEVKLLIEKFPERLDLIRSLEIDLIRSFFPPNYIPDKYCTKRDKKTGKKINMIDDVIRYLRKVKDPRQIELLPENKKSCESIYNICE